MDKLNEVVEFMESMRNERTYWTNRLVACSRCYTIHNGIDVYQEDDGFFCESCYYLKK